ncbi:bifunctional methylenetetrahydrofolate dehydrogenase/methenyltetrahydrofolate cyclohydrolase FolD [Rossellomorea vietnamensis]|uniref:Bifunctional protein FolD n=1 Tax=Rossellomorea vietnamensis TaxID=218284 RepID=A0A5D4KHS7_9BACI|nr:bifunctional methylenetetrahydrofolate dehydrogenase/methenyltetrahydrofolate cyclohydrolase FolD [Rossellomorea vietnamensis]TYR76315.1 bifunctional methylenetetrahydrofolate dehydrogenase/methenyltetrahydrofolate cyclohydrolase FolD [Rossellomorea vietnamensis]
MPAKLIDGKKIANHYRNSIAEEVKQLRKDGMAPGLAVILVGEDSASQTYVRMKRKTCQEMGIHSILIEYGNEVGENELLEKIQQLNDDKAIHGILVQLPLPEGIQTEKVIEQISPDKDVDGFHPVNIGRMMIGEDSFLPCTPYGIMKMLQYEGISPSGKHAVVVGRSNIVGKPAGQLLLRENATVTYCHSKTENLVSYTRSADILISAAGRPNFISGKDIKPGAIVIDVGMNRDENGRLCGDIDFETAKETAGYITPVPGGVGPMTITMLMFNTVKSARRAIG